MTDEARHADDSPRVGARGWNCQAYGPTPGQGDLCFCALEGACASRPECEARMLAERLYLWVRLQSRAAAGDQTCIDALKGFDEPQQLLNGELWQSESE